MEQRFVPTARSALIASELHLEVAAITDRGQVRDRNEDFFAYYVPGDPARRIEHGSLFAVADGVGGGPAGNVASAEAVNVLLQEYYFSPAGMRPEPRLRHAFERVGAHLYEVSQAHAGFRSMQTTLTGLLVRGRSWSCCHVGDTRLYLVRGGAMRQVTRDHSLAADLAGWGIIAPADADAHPGRHVLTRSLGAEPLVRVDVASGRLTPGDLFLLVTDGMVAYVPPAELVLLVSEAPSLAAGVDRAGGVAKDRGGDDNLTLLAVRVAQAGGAEA